MEKKENETNEEVKEEIKESKKDVEAREAKQKLIDDTNAAAERLEKANKTHEELIAKLKSDKVNETVAGETDAGSKEKSQDEIDTDDAKALLKGTGMESALD